MGLDVYLMKCDDIQKANALEQQYEDRSNELWKGIGDYKTATDAQKEDIRKKTDEFAISLGLDKYGSSPDKEEIQFDSKQHPKHLFKVGYFRSSYNEGGINSVLGQLGISDLYEIFSPNDEYEFTPDWQDALEKVKIAIKQLDTFCNDPVSKYHVATCSFFEMVEDASKAFELFKAELERNHGKDFQEYSNRSGHFYLKGLKVHALMFGKNCIGSPCVYTVYSVDQEENKEDDDSGYKWYLQALKVVQETIEYVLSQPNPEKHYLRWSS